jgi:peptidoglycan-associated lipoprotein
MKRKLMLVLTLMMIATVALLTTSCAKLATQSQTETTGQPKAPVATEAREVTAEQAEPEAMETAPAATEAAIVNERIYFGYDSAALPDQAPSILKSMAEYLRINPGLSVTVQGHCDERGTDAYNMELGERRAEAVRQFLVDNGIAAHRLAAVSYGKTRPVAIGQNEASWAQNRRAEFEIN